MNSILLKEAKKEHDEITARLKPELDKLAALESVLKAFSINGGAPPVHTVNGRTTIGDTIANYISLTGKFIKGSVIESGILYSEEKQFSQVLADAKKLGKIVCYKVDNNNHKAYWGLPEWMEKGEPKQGYEITET